MFNSTTLEVVIGLSFCFASVALIASSINEALASLLGLRAATLLEGIKDLLNDQQFTGLAKGLYNHALINPLLKAHATKQSNLSTKPSYIDSRHFAEAFIECLEGGPKTFGEVGAAIEQVSDPQLQAMLRGMYRRAGGELDALRTDLANWFDAGMRHVSGVYKRHAQAMSFLIAFYLAVLLNVDACRVFRVLWLHPGAVAQLAKPETAGGALEQLATLPIGWGARAGELASSRAVVVAGWLITASAALFGAPFWFDVLQRFVNLRGTGQKPGGAAPVKKDERTT
jgi:hypothetical protein